MGSFYSVSAKISNKKYGWKPDIPDVRDKKLKFSNHHYTQMRSKIDLRSDFGSVYTQGSLGSCTANAICGAFVYDQKKQNLPKFNPSRLFLYYNERDMENTVNIDSGASIRDGIKSINKQGVCEEVLWPYQIEYFTNKPLSNCYKEAKFHKGIRYKRLTNDLDSLKTCLSLGRPFIFGFAVYESFEDPTSWDPKNDAMPIPNPNKEKLLGGHAVVAVGYSDKRKSFLIRNSWGREFGMDGYFLMPYKYITSEACSDFWVLETVSDDEIIVENKEYKLKVEKDSYMEVVAKSKKKKKPKRRKDRKRLKKYNYEEDNDSICEGSDGDIKTVQIEIPKKENNESKCLIREN